jgi:hypothetical protein
VRAWLGEVCKGELPHMTAHSLGSCSQGRVGLYLKEVGPLQP